MKTSKLLILGMFAASLVMVAATPALAKINVTSLGFRANQGGGGKLDLGWGGGNMGNTWTEGEWVPYQLVLTKVQESYPNLVGMNIEISYDFTTSGSRFIDLVRGLQVGTTPRTDAQGWPNDSGTAYPMATRAQIEEAQNDVGNAPPLDNAWTGFQLLNLPDSQINRNLTGGTGTPTDGVRKFIITPANLIAAGIAETANTIVIYYQLHESRTFIWSNGLQEGYDASPTDAWGGYIYGDPPFDADSRTGSGYVPGSSGHVHVLTLGGSQDVPIPIPETLPGIVSGMKWEDSNYNGVMDGGESPLSGWRIFVYGNIEGIDFMTSTLTDVDGLYSFPDLTSGTWRIAEATDREVPAETGYKETYPESGDSVGVATAAAHTETGQAAWGWDVILTLATPDQADVDFGNFLGTPSVDIEKFTNGQDADTPTGPYIQVSNPVTWRYEVTNNGDLDLTSVVVTDDKGTPGTGDDFNPTYISGDGGVAGTLEVGETWIFETSGTAAAGQYANEACVSAWFGSIEVTDCDPSHYFGIDPDISIAKTVDFNGDSVYGESETYYAGAPAAWKIIVTNTGNSPVYDIYVTDDNGQNFGPFDLLTNGAFQTIDYTTNPTAGLTNTASAQGLDELGETVGPVSDPATVAIIAPTIAIAKTVDFNGDSVYGELETYYASADADWKIIVTNTGDSPVYGIVVTDDNGHEFGAPFNLLTNGAFQTFEYTTNPTTGLTNTASAQGVDDLGGTVGPVSDPATVAIINPDMAIAKTVDFDGDGFYSESETYYASAPADWKIVVTNTGGSPIYDIVVTDDNGHDFGAPFDLLTNGASKTFEYTTNPTTGLTNTAYAQGLDQLDGVVGPVNDPAEVVVIAPQISIAKTVDFDGDTVYGDFETNVAGEPADWKIVVTNTGNSPVYNILVGDDNGQIFGLFDLLTNGASQTLDYTTYPTANIINEACAGGIDELGNDVGPVCDPAEVAVAVTGGGFCTFTQGYYGNAGGTKCGGKTTTELLVDLLEAADASTAGSYPVVVGVLGVRSITFDTANCILLRLPAGGTPSVLPANVGQDPFGDRNCADLPSSLVKKNKPEINNVLVGQVVTLTLNLRLYNYGCEEGIGDLAGEALPEEFCTMGKDGCPKKHTTPDGFAGMTASEILALANNVIAGEDVGFSPSEINGAVSFINETFDECVEVITCPVDATEICNNDCDDNVDGLTDCDDPQCVSDAACIVAEP